MLPRLSDLEYSITNAIHILQFRWNFETLLVEYIETRGELAKVIIAIDNIGEVMVTVKEDSIESIFVNKFALAMKLAITAARRINALVTNYQW